MKTTTFKAEPRVGRFRLYDKAGARWKCRACGDRFRKDNLDRHYRTEVERLGAEELKRVIAIGFLRGRKLRYLNDSRRNWQRAVDRVTEQYLEEEMG